MKKFLKGFKHAFDGLVYAISTQKNMQFHIIAALLAILAGVIFSITALEWLLVSSAIILVIAAELINTAIESLTDLVTTEKHPLAKAAKDTAAAAVLVCALWAVLVGVYVFSKYFSAILDF